ncbi:hypothetical protein M9H77_34627 [Catharanthus roseus]|uniref:Uncharacterized protein n=1 Tax=Catharanthus roseus TaxID=4058 RepID=A0ACB9ZLP8_CATRO|nr:hypothetical protein M9H77_34627 [Catharanthus roseus]
MIDATTGYEALSFMDGLSGYNQIKMAPQDKELTAFCTSKGIYCYKKKIFDDLLHKMMECYVNDLVYFQIQQFVIVYVYQKAVRGQVLADFLADHPIPAEWKLNDELPDENVLVIEVLPPRKMFFDGASHREEAGAGVVYFIPQGDVLLYEFTLSQQCPNNYQALILVLKLVVDMKQLQLEVYGDSQLMVNQLLGVYEVKKPKLLPYYKYVRRLMGWLGDVTISHVLKNR